jgi:hypothetical protein
MWPDTPDRRGSGARRNETDRATVPVAARTSAAAIARCMNLQSPASILHYSTAVFARPCAWSRAPTDSMPDYALPIPDYELTLAETSCMRAYPGVGRTASSKSAQRTSGWKPAMMAVSTSSSGRKISHEN